MMLDQLLARYKPFDEVEAVMVRQLQTFLSDISNSFGHFGRELHGHPSHCGHVTGSAWIVNPDGSRAVLVHHAKLNRWLQPGGHCDGESDVLSVALREAKEETGLEVVPLQRDIFDIDVHPIPEYWNTPQHRHYDVRFLLQADDGLSPRLSSESHAVRWVNLEEVTAFNNSDSIARMVLKTCQRQLAKLDGLSRLHR